MARPKAPEQVAEEANAERPSQILRILAQLRGEGPGEAVEADADQNDDDLVQPLTPGQQTDLAGFRARAGRYRGLSPVTKR